MTTIAVLGTGTIGAPMARNLQAAGHDVRAWNRTYEKALELTLAQAVARRFGAAEQLGHGEDDMAAVAEAVHAAG